MRVQLRHLMAGGEGDQYRYAWIVILVAFTLLLAGICVWRYLTVQAHVFDLGNDIQAWYLISHGSLTGFITASQTDAIGQDASFIAYPFALIYRYLGGVIPILVIQAAAVGVAGAGVRQYAKDYKLSDRAATLLMALFLLFPGVSLGAIFDFHYDFIAAPFLVWGLVWYGQGEKWAALIAFVVAILCKDLVLVALLAWGLGLMAGERKWKDGLLAAVASFCILVVYEKLIFANLQHDGSWRFAMYTYGYLGHGLLSDLVGLPVHAGLVLQQVASGWYYFLLFLPVLGLPLLHKVFRWPVIVLFGINLLSLFAQQRWMINQYQLILAVYLWAGLIPVIARMGQPRLGRPLKLMVIAGATFFLVNADLAANLYLAHPLPDFTELTGINRSIPQSSLVISQEALGTEFAARPFLLLENNLIAEWYGSNLGATWAYEETMYPGPHTTYIVYAYPVSSHLASVIEAALHDHYVLHRYPNGIFVVSGKGEFIVPSSSRRSRSPGGAVAAASL